MAEAAVLHYSRGRDISDNRPTQRVAAGIVGLLAALDGDRASRKESAAYICGPMNGEGRRCAKGALPRSWLAVDLDRIDASALSDVERWFGRFSAGCWPTHSSTPEAPRLRVIIELADAASRDECISIGTRLKHELTEEFGDRVVVDPCTFRPEQPVFVPPAGVAIQRFQGSPLPVPRMNTAPTTGRVRPTEEAQRNSEVALSSSVPLLSSSVGVRDWPIPATTVPSEVGQRNGCLFKLARHVKAEFPEATKAELRAIALKWHEVASPVIGTTDFAVTLADFMRGVEKVRQPYGTVLQVLLSKMDEEAAPLPEVVAALGYGGACNRLLRICAALQAHQGAEPFFLSARQAGTLIDVHFTDASKMLSTLVIDGVLQLVSRGSGKVASRYRYVLR